MPVSLSHDTYPDIVDSIVAHADHATSLALRLTCRSIQSAVDRHQVAHLVLTPGGSNDAAVRGPVHRVAAVRRLGPKSRPSLKLTQHVRVLDVRGYFPATCNLTLLKPAFPALRTVRMCTRRGAYTPYVPVGAGTVVLFTSPHGGDCNPEAQGGMEQLVGAFSALLGPAKKEKPVVPRGVRAAALPDSVRKLVVNMSGEDYAVAEMFAFVLDPPAHVREIVVVLPRVEPAAFAGGLLGVSGDTFAPKIVAMDLAELMVGVPHVRYTLVGLEGAGRTRPAFAALLRKQLQGYQFAGVRYADEPELVATPGGGYELEHHCREPAKHDAQVDGIMGQLEMLSFTEYVQRVGEATAREELVEYADGTGRGVTPRGVLMNDFRRMGPAAQED